MEFGCGAQGGMSAVPLQVVLDMAEQMRDMMPAQHQAGFNHVIDLVRSGSVAPSTLLQALKDMQRGSGGTSTQSSTAAPSFAGSPTPGEAFGFEGTKASFLGWMAETFC